MENVLLSIHVIISLALVFVVLLQRSEGGALGMGGGGSGGGGMGLFSARGAASALTRTTAILATAFMISSLLLAIVAGKSRENSTFSDIFDSDAQGEQTEQKPSTIPLIPEAQDFESQPPSQIPGTE